MIGMTFGQIKKFQEKGSSFVNVFMIYLGFFKVLFRFSLAYKLFMFIVSLSSMIPNYVTRYVSHHILFYCVCSQRILRYIFRWIYWSEYSRGKACRTMQMSEQG